MYRKPKDGLSLIGKLLKTAGLLPPNKLWQGTLAQRVGVGLFSLVAVPCFALANGSMGNPRSVTALYLSELRQLTFDGNNIAASFSPTDDNLLAFSKSKYEGIYLLNIFEDSSQRTFKSSRHPIQVTGEPKTGFGFLWSPDGNGIIFRSVNRGANHVGMINTVTQQYADFSGECADVSLPAIKNGNVFFSKDGAEVMVDLSRYGTRLKRSSTNIENEVSVLGQGDKILVGGNVINPSNQACWLPRVSPDGNKLSFECVSGLHVYDVQTQRRNFLGNGTNASWANDSQRLVYEITIDDGETVTASDIYLINADSTGKINLTADINAVARRPSLSADGTNLAVDIDGNIFVANLIEGRVP